MENRINKIDRIAENKRKIKAAFFDLDGTLVSFDTHRIPEEAMRALSILKKKGLDLFISTGRPPIQLQRNIEQLDQVGFDGMVTMNGQYCTTGDEVVRQVQIPRESLEMLIPWLEENNIACNFVERDYTYLNHDSEEVQRVKAEFGPGARFEPVDSTDRIYDNPVYQLNPYIPEELEEDFLAHCPGVRFVRWNPVVGDVIPDQGGKHVGIASVLEKYGITPDEYIAFGDGQNDIEMLEHAGIGVAMGNASDEVKAAADYVTTDLEDNGIVNGLYAMGLLTPEEKAEALGVPAEKTPSDESTELLPHDPEAGKKIKAAFFDIDGTLVSFKTHDIPESTLRALKELKEKGIKIFLAIGRPPEHLVHVPHIDTMGFDGTIALNGQYVTVDDKLIRERWIAKEDLEQLLPWLDESHTACSFFELEYSYLNFMTPAVEELNRVLGATSHPMPVNSTDRIQTERVYQLNGYFGPGGEVEFLAHLPNCKAARWNDIFADIMPADGGKPEGIQSILDHYGYDKTECIAFGDGGNDVDMLDFAGIGVAMGNGGDEAKAAADFIAPTVDEDGILRTLKAYSIL